MKKEISIFWFRRDLRLQDNVGLYFALKNGNPTLCIFIFDQNILSKLDNKDSRVSFIYNEILEIKKKLKEKGSDLKVYFGKPDEIYKRILKEYNVKDVYCNEDYEPYALKRDSGIERILSQNGVVFHQYKDQCIFAKGEILKNDGDPYTVYTPYKNKWYSNLKPSDISSYSSERQLNGLVKIKFEKMIPIEKLGFEIDEKIKMVRAIKSKIIKEYGNNRDFPAMDATSKLGIHLRFGTISVRKCVQIAWELNRVWLDELVWREFFMQILFHFPKVVNRPFKSKYEKIKWLNNKSEFKKWCDGMTGYPIVDAGMRQLNETGYMHNRVRMITASFLVKHLLIDYRWGEKYFAQKLLDFDLSANNGNWQWVAGTGCDAAPYFRIFNPYTQTKKFDHALEYIKKWVPEYETSKYPPPMIDHPFAYQRALNTYKKALK